MKKILIINLDKSIFKPGSRSLANLKEYSHFFEKLFVITWTLEKEKPIFFEDRLFVYPTNSKSKFFYFWESFLIARKVLRENKIDLLFTQDPFETGLTGWLITKLFKISLQFQIHTDVFSSYFWKESFVNKIRVLLAKLLISRANCLRVVSERIKNSLISKYPNIEISRIAVLPIFVDVEKIKNILVKADLHQKYPQFDFIVLMASRLSKEKNIGLAIKAMAEVVKKYPKTGLVIAGDGPERKALESEIRNYGLGKNVVLEGAIFFEKLISYYKTADLFLLTSNYEGYGMAVIEAMASGCPVVMTDVGLAGEVLENNKEGVVVPVGDVERLGQAILSLIQNKELRKHFSSAALEKVKTFPSKEIYLNNYKNLLEFSH